MLSVTVDSNSTKLLDKDTFNVFQLLVIIEFILYLVLSIWIGILAYICYTVKVFHQHLNALMFTIFFNFYLLIIVRTSFLIITHFNPEYGSYYKFYSSNNIIILSAYQSGASYRGTFLYHLNEFKYVIFNLYTLSIPALVAERTYATVKLLTYESTVIPYSFFLAILINWIIGGILVVIAKQSQSYLIFLKLSKLNGF